MPAALPPQLAAGKGGLGVPWESPAALSAAARPAPGLGSTAKLEAASESLKLQPENTGAHGRVPADSSSPRRSRPADGAAEEKAVDVIAGTTIPQRPGSAPQLFLLFIFSHQFCLLPSSPPFL